MLTPEILESLLQSLHPFKAKIVQDYLSRGQTQRALALLSPAQTEPEAPQAAPKPLKAPKPSLPAPPPSAGLLLAQASRGALDDHPLPCPSDADPKWQHCKRVAFNRIRIKSGALMPLKQTSKRYGEQPGPGSFVALLLALALYFRDHKAQTQFSVFAPQWVIADLLGVSPDTLQRWQKLPEVRRWLLSWRWRDRQCKDRQGREKVAGMLYTVRFTPKSPQKKPPYDLLQLPLRNLALDAKLGRIRGKTPDERLQVRGSIKSSWQHILPINLNSLVRFSELKNLVEFVAAHSAPPPRSARMVWAQQLVEALQRHLGLGDQPQTRTKLYWKIALTCLRGLLYGGDEAAQEPLRMVQRALGKGMKMANKLHNPGAFFSKKLQEEGFFELAGFYGNRKVA